MNGFKVTWSELDTLLPELKTIVRNARYRGADKTSPTTAIAMSALRRLYCEGGKPWDIEKMWESRRYFFGAFISAVVRTLIDHARKRHRRPATLVCPQDLETFVSYAGAVRLADERPNAYLEIEKALRLLYQENRSAATVVWYRAALGMTVAETAILVERSETTVKSAYAKGIVWLRKWLDGGQVDVGSTVESP